MQPYIGCYNHRNNQIIVQDTVVADVMSDHSIIGCKLLHAKLRLISVAGSARKCHNVDMSAVKSDISDKLLLITDLS